MACYSLLVVTVALSRLIFEIGLYWRRILFGINDLLAILMAVRPRKLAGSTSSMGFLVFYSNYSSKTPVLKRHAYGMREHVQLHAIVCRVMLCHCGYIMWAIFACFLIVERQGYLHTKAHSDIRTVSCQIFMWNLPLDYLILLLRTHSVVIHHLWH